MTKLLLVALPLSLLACTDAGSEAEDVRFEVRSCGRAGFCNAEAPLAVGGQMTLVIGNEVFDAEALVGATVESSAPEIARIELVDARTMVRAQVVGVAPGDAELAVFEADGTFRGAFSLRIRAADRLALEITPFDPAAQPVLVPGTPPQYVVKTNALLRIEAVPYVAEEILNGAFTEHSLSVVSNAPADEALATLEPLDAAGVLAVRVTGYDHDVTIGYAGLETSFRLSGR